VRLVADDDDATYRCARAERPHAVDAGRSGYVNLLGRARGGDGRAQLRARRAFLSRGHFSELAAAVAEEALARDEDDDDAREGEEAVKSEVASSSSVNRTGASTDASTSPRARKLAKKRAERRRRRDAEEGERARGGVDAVVVARRWRVVDFGCGEGYYARAVRDAAMGRDDLALELAAFDVAKDAADLAAASLGGDARVAVADATRDVPLMNDSVDAVISVFAPRSPSELARVVRAGGRVCVARPGEDHMRELRELNGDGVTVLGVEPGKSDRVDASMLSNGFEIVRRREIHGALTLSEEDVFDLLYMGPSGHHNEESAIRAAARDAPRVVTKSFEVVVYRRISESNELTNG